MLCRYFIILLLLLSSCSSGKQSTKFERNEVLDFSKCIISTENYNYLTIDMPDGYTKKFQPREGICEYRFIYSNGTTAYISSDVWYGSPLNVKNRNDIGHTTYRKGGLVDTIILNGIQQHDSLFWSEKILGDLMVGYLNATFDMKNLLEDSFVSIRKSR